MLPFIIIHIHREMAVQTRVVSIFFIQLVLLAVSGPNRVDGAGLRTGYYDESCPDAETIALKTIRKAISKDVTVAAALLRLHFHDCFVRGCEASVLLDAAEEGDAEKDASPNFSLRGYDVIDDVKSAIETSCPGVVSCADILALAARDAVRLTGGSFWKAETGRRDGRISLSKEADENLPSSNFNIAQLKQNFASKGLTKKDLAVLSGAHTIGVTSCFVINDRLYNFTGRSDTDPALDPTFASELKKKCKPGGGGPVLELDQGSSKISDAHFYKAVKQNRGLLVSDAALLNDHVTRAYVNRQSTSAAAGATFGRDFGESMEKMGRIGVLTGNEGEIRKRCAFVN
ncbi:unnamed protein product [Linum tenue]|uniref:Peroxidase n=1 Tax=Linum tenue TaxID=586396 RepID=A0AAV0RYT3_9ROSI|nr:unnamed protein product [Linum tenue]